MLKTAKTSYLIRGIVFFVLALICFGTPEGTLTSIAWIAGIALFIAGAATFFLGKNRKEHKSNTLSIIAACAMVLAGLLIIIQPHIIAMLIGVFIFLEGIEFIIASTRCRKASIRYWGLILALGIIVAVMGALAIVSPQMGAALISIAVGTGLLFIGINCFITMACIDRVEAFFQSMPTDASLTTTDNTTYTEAKIVE